MKSVHRKKNFKTGYLYVCFRFPSRPPEVDTENHLISPATENTYQCIASVLAFQVKRAKLRNLFTYTIFSFGQN